MMARQARPSAKINGFDTHMILEAVPAQPSERSNGHQAINPTSRHYAEALPPTHHGRRLAAHQAGITKEGDGRSRQQGDATHQAHGLSSAARLPVPTVLLFARRSAAPATADATAVLAPVKVVRPAGRSTLTAAAGRNIKQLPREQPDDHTPPPQRS